MVRLVVFLQGYHPILWLSVQIIQSIAVYVKVLVDRFVVVRIDLSLLLELLLVVPMPSPVVTLSIGLPASSLWWVLREILLLVEVLLALRAVRFWPIVSIILPLFGREVVHWVGLLKSVVSSLLEILAIFFHGLLELITASKLIAVTKATTSFHVGMVPAGPRLSCETTTGITHLVLVTRLLRKLLPCILHLGEVLLLLRDHMRW